MVSQSLALAEVPAAEDAAEGRVADVVRHLQEAGLSLSLSLSLSQCIHIYVYTYVRSPNYYYRKHFFMRGFYFGNRRSQKQ